MQTQQRIHRKDFNLAGHAHSLTFSCYRRHRFLAADRCCQWLADAIGESRKSLDFAVWAYVFMPEHAHIILYPRQLKYDISAIRRAIKSPVGRNAIRYLQKHSPEWLRKMTRKRGSKTERLFWLPGGGYDRNIDSPSTLLREIDYVHLNPVKRGFVDRAELWKWSSAASFYGTGDSPLKLDAIPADWLT